MKTVDNDNKSYVPGRQLVTGSAIWLRNRRGDIEVRSRMTDELVFVIERADLTCVGEYIEREAFEDRIR